MCWSLYLQVLNILLRLAWIQSMTHLTFGSLDSCVMDFIFAALEIFRRGHWNFYRCSMLPHLILFVLFRFFLPSNHANKQTNITVCTVLRDPISCNIIISYHLFHNCCAYQGIYVHVCRLENEHLNNVGKYRATKQVPLPFEDTTPKM